MVGETLLDIADLEVSYLSSGGPAAVRGLDLSVRTDEVFGLVGESGSGKTTLAMAILGSLPRSAAITRGSLRFAGRDLRSASPAVWREIRWRELAYIPQGAMNVLNPVRRVRAQFGDMLADHLGARLSREWEARLRALISSVRLPETVLERYPHELSGGMRQRVCIAMAILFEPKLIVADELTSALDVVSQRVVLQTLAAVRSRIGASIILIGHDLALQAQIADRLGIMFSGRLVETGPVREIFHNPAHPYTRRLLASIPSLRPHEGVPNLPVPTAAERWAWLGGAGMYEVSPGHFVRSVEVPVKVDA